MKITLDNVVFNDVAELLTALRGSTAPEPVKDVPQSERVQIKHVGLYNDKAELAQWPNKLYAVKYLRDVLRDANVDIDLISTKRLVENILWIANHRD